MTLTGGLAGLAAPGAGAAVSATLYEKDNPESRVVFQFNPAVITVEHQTTVKEVGASSAMLDDVADTSNPSGRSVTASTILDEAGLTSFRVSDFLVTGAAVLTSCATLLRWSYAVTSGDDPGATAKTAALVPLQFAWGQFRVSGTTATPLDVILTKTTIAYERFDASGTPIRARVGIDLRLHKDDPLRQNPSSAGLPNRRGHTVTQGETLPGIARAAYGHPRAWRALATANGIDDPLRLRPGTLLYVPERGEASGGAS